MLPWGRKRVQITIERKMDPWSGEGKQGFLRLKKRGKEDDCIFQERRYVRHKGGKKRERGAGTESTLHRC